MLLEIAKGRALLAPRGGNCFLDVRAAAIGVVAAVLSGDAVIAALFILGSAGMVVVGLTSEGVNRPIWRQIEHWSPERTAAGWDRKRSHWHLAHQVRTYAAIASVAAYVGAFVLGTA